jgi:hypothetical protein
MYCYRTTRRSGNFGAALRARHYLRGSCKTIASRPIEILPLLTGFPIEWDYNWTKYVRTRLSLVRLPCKSPAHIMATPITYLVRSSTQCLQTRQTGTTSRRHYRSCPQIAALMRHLKPVGCYWASCAISGDCRLKPWRGQTCLRSYWSRKWTDTCPLHDVVRIEMPGAVTGALCGSGPTKQALAMAIANLPCTNHGLVVMTMMLHLPYFPRRPRC